MTNTPIAVTQEKALGRFGHHPDPATDFCVEVEELDAIVTDLEIGFPNPVSEREAIAREVRAMEFVVGGDLIAIQAKAHLRQIEGRLVAFAFKQKGPRRPYGGQLS